MKKTLSILLLAAGALGSVFAAQPLSSARYATDAYPGFDSESEIVAPSKKEPRWFAWFNGPTCKNPADQLAYCESLVAAESYSKAAKQFDALVREWPVSPEALTAQLRLAELLLVKLDDAEEAFAEYRYAADFYSMTCDFTAVLDKMYQIANLMRKQGKDFIFFHFDNTIDVRRAYEACVLRAPGATWAPQAMLAIAALREDEGKFDEAVKVYENLRNLHSGSPESREAFVREARTRMQLLKDHGYNRLRTRDTVDFMKLALRNCELDKVEEVKGLLAEVEARLEEDDYRAAKFYDSPTRTVRSAINAYEKFLQAYPGSAHAAEIAARLEILKGNVK